MALLNIFKSVHNSFLVLQIYYYFYKTIIAINKSYFQDTTIKFLIWNIVESLFILMLGRIEFWRVTLGFYVKGRYCLLVVIFTVYEYLEVWDVLFSILFH